VGLAVDAESLYVAGLDGSTIAKVPLAGGSLTTVASSPDAPIGVAVDAASVYWTTAGGSVMKAPIGGGAPTVLASGQKSCTRPVVDAATASVYWGDPDDGTIMSVPLDGGSATLVTSGGAATDIAIAGADVVFASGYTLMKAPLSGGTPTSLGTAAGAPVLAVASDGTSAYFTSYGSIWKVALSAGQGATVASNQDAPSAIAVDATSVYWTNGTGGQVVKLTPK
jgi:sugar lactone lactonase YvrE